MNFIKQGALFLFYILLLPGFNVQSVLAQPLTTGEIDQLVEKTLHTFLVPGIAVGIVKDGKLLHAKGYGVRSLQSKLPVDANTLFGIASNSKAFTTAALGILVDEGKFSWDTRVQEIIPEFRMYDPYVSAAFTIRDLVTHRSGLGLGAGDLMWWPDSTNFSINDVLKALPHLKPVAGFRSKYDYNNLLFMVAGEVVERVSGQTWEAFVETRIMKPIGMTQSAATWQRLPDTSNAISAHAPADGQIALIPRDIFRFGAAAAGIYANITDLAKWVSLQLNGGQYGPEKTRKLWSKKIQDEMWTPQTPIAAEPKPPYHTRFNSYGLGWFVSDVKGYKQVTHTGGLGGMVTQVLMLPELGLGIIVLTNQQSGAAFTAISNSIKDGYLGLPKTDHVAVLSKRMQGLTIQADSITHSVFSYIAEKRAKTSPYPLKITGKYHDNWLGDVLITERNGRTWFAAVKAPKLSGELLYYKNNTWVVKWTRRSFDADAYLEFDTNLEGKPTAIRMKAISPMTDFSFDFHDLDLRWVAPLDPGNK